MGDQIPNDATTMTMPEPANNKIDIGSLIPEQYRSIEWVQNTLKAENPVEELVKKNIHAQSLIGKLGNDAVVVPKPDAPPDEWAKFAEQATKAYPLESYTIKPTEWGDQDKELGQAIEQATPKALLDAMAKSAKANGVTPVQLQNLKVDLDKASVVIQREAIENAQKQHQDAIAKWNEDFEAKAKKVFGDKKDEVLSMGKNLLETNTPAELKEELKKLPNEALVILAANLGAVAKNYIREDKFNVAGVAPTGMTKESILEEARALMKTDEYQNIMNPGHDAMKKKVNDTFKRLDQIQT